MTSTTTDISYLVIDENEESLECGTVFEVLGTTFSTGRVGGNGTHVHLRNCRTDEVCRMWISTFYVGGFRALPLDQVSQDRKDAGDFDAAPKITDDRTGEIWAVAGTAYGTDGKTVAGIWVLDATEDGGAVKVPLAELRSHGTIRAYPRTPEPLQPAPIVEYRVLDTKTSRKFAVLGTTRATGSAGSDIWLRAEDTQQTEHMWVSTFAVMRNFVAICSHGYTVHDSCPNCDQAEADDFPCCAAAHRHEVAEQCGIADSELPTTLPVSADRLLGRALYLIRELLAELDSNSLTAAQSRRFLAEVDAS